MTSVQASIATADIADWVTVAAYSLAALLCDRSARRAALLTELREQAFWRYASALLLFLGINELIDLQTLLTSAGRSHAKANGWYEERRMVQLIFVLILAVGAIIGGIVSLWLTRGSDVAVRLALAGFVFIGLFVFLRAVSFHHVDEWLGRGAPFFNWGSLQEIAGILIVASAAILYRHNRRSIS